jgi:hypothetical protein
MRLVEKAGLDLRAESTSEVIAMLIQGAKQQGDIVRASAVGFKVTDAMLVAMAGRIMALNHSAIGRLAEVVGSTVVAMQILHAVQDVAEDSLVAMKPSE